jgi:hypothetical protein
MILNSSKRGPNAYTRLTSPPSLIDAAAKRATVVTTRKKSPREKSELAKWEGEGGAATPPTEAQKTLHKPLTMKPGMTATAIDKAAAVANKNKRS